MIDKETLIELYINQQLTLIEIGKMYGFSSGGVRKWLIKNEILLRKRGSVRPEIEKERVEKIRKTSTGRTHSQKSKDKISNARKGMNFSKETRDKMRDVKLGLNPWNKNTKGLQIAWNKGKENLHFKGDKNPNWKGGITSENKAIRSSLEYKLWRKQVFERDNYTCQICNKKGGQLQADHIKPFCNFKELRFDINNGRTLCKPCHKQTDTYGYKALNFKPE